MRALGRWLVALFALLLGRRRGEKKQEGEQEKQDVQDAGAVGNGRIVPAGEPDRRAENVLIILLLAAALCAVAFVVFYGTDRLPAQTQLMGVALGLCFSFLAAAMILVAKRLIVTEEIEEEYPEESHDEDQEEVTQIVRESGSRFTRKRLLGATAGLTGGALGVALVTPVLSWGPFLDMDPLYRSPWRRGVRLVDKDEKPYRASDIQPETFYTAYPEGVDRELLAAPLVVIRLATNALHLPPERADWAPQGILAFSKICTHAGCAIALYRKPTFPSVEPKPALVCPCHYSTFDPATGGKVIFGPAGRPLPQLPLEIDPAGDLRAGGNYSEPIGPSWWGVRMGGPE